jgi:hypothetical protein
MEISNAITAIPDTSAPAWAQFNKITGVFTGIYQKVPLETLNQEYFDYVEIEIDSIRQHVVGTKDNFEIVDRAEEAQVIHEIAMNNQAQGKIDKKYPIYKRLDIIDRVLSLLCEKLDVNDSEFFEMQDYIKEVQHTNELIKEAIANDPAYNYVSIQQQLEKMDAQIEGGLHEYFGPRESAPQILGTPFMS